MDNAPARFGEKGAKGLTRIRRALIYSFEGLGSAFIHEEAFRMEVVALVVLTPMAFVMPVSWFFRALLIAAVLLVMVVELLNSAVEAVVDYISKDKHPLAKRAKDMASAAVFLSVITCAAIWGIAIYSSLDAIMAMLGFR
ncbi:MAG TPA: diacylglycerol kinase [Opitutales bacterium]|nr:diacylglycerol kinase [Opitutales bacterium]